MRKLLTIVFLLLAATDVFAHQNEVTITTDTLFRTITSNGIPDHKTGAFPNKGNPNTISEQAYNYRVGLNPKYGMAVTPLDHYNFGVALNGVPFDPGTAEWWQHNRASGWNYDALSGKIDLGVDENNAH